MKKISTIFYSFVFATILFACQYQSPKVGQYHSIDAESFKIVVRNQNVQVLDVRTDGEYIKGHIPSAVNIDINEQNFNNRCRKVFDTHYPIAVYCHSGKRSHIAAGILVDMGYEVYELEGGVLGWTGDVDTGVN